MIILRTPWGGPWRRFQRPARVISASSAGQVREALAEVDDAVGSGAYAAGFITYEAAAAFALPAAAPPPGLPLVWFGIFDEFEVDSLGHFPARGGAATLDTWSASISHEEYLQAIEQIKARIAAGDTYQINFTFRLTAPFAGSPLALMRDLYAAQAGPWSAYVDIGSHVICSASPELFFLREGNRLECRPMKGTAPRGLWPAQDAAFGEALRASEKNRAENVMIVDMVRNDLGRVASFGSVQVSSLFDVERYPLQWQMTSTVVAETGTASLDALFEALFPTGSITGAPKHSAMDIIRELERSPRGIYTGAIGYLSPHGRSHFNVAIRTVCIDRATSVAEFGVGSGVVWDSVDRDEYDECLLKARMVTTAGEWSRTGSASYVLDSPPGFRLLESLLWTPQDGFVLLGRHIDRLTASAACFGFRCDAAEVTGMLSNAVADLRGPSKIRLQVEADGTLLCEAVDLAPLRQPLRVALADRPADRRNVFLYHKTTKRDVYERARAAHPEVDTVILWNDAGEITEATDFNVVVDLGGKRVTPPVDCGLLPGTFRAELLANGEITERRISREELRQAPAIWLINSVRGWVRARLVRTGS